MSNDQFINPKTKVLKINDRCFIVDNQWADEIEIETGGDFITLQREEVEKLIPALQQWLKTNVLPIESKDTQ